MEGVWLMLNQDKPKSYVLASGEMHSIREFLEEALKCAGLDFIKTGEGSEERYTLPNSEKVLVSINPKYYRPAEVHKLCGDCSLAEKEMQWNKKTDFSGLVKKMYENDYRVLSK